MLGSWFVVLASSMGCSSVADPDGTGGSAGDGTTSSTTGTTTATTGTASTSTGATGTACEQYCAAFAGCPGASSDCVATCDLSTGGACPSEWDAYTTCLAQTFDSGSCLWDFHACEPEATAVMACQDITFGLNQCEVTADGCDCTYAVVGSDFGWSCVEGPNGFSCDCTHDGVPTGSCSEAGSGQCGDDTLQIGCCLSL